jgi:hypothetical protein
VAGKSTRSERLVANREIPEKVPVRPQGSILVIARVVWSDGIEEWRAARAIRWTSTHVMVAWKDDDNDPRSERYEWLRAGDVCRTVSWFVPPAPRQVARREGQDVGGTVPVQR